MTDEEIRKRRLELQKLSVRRAGLESALRTMFSRGILLEQLDFSADQLDSTEAQSSGGHEALLQERTRLLLELERHPAPERREDDRTFLLRFRKIRGECEELEERMREIRRELIRDHKNK